jgi:hypothetical protein
MSWGIKIAAVYIGFVGLIAFLIFKTSQQNIDLVSEDYYQQELEYQDRIDQQTATISLGTQPVVILRDGNVDIVFPDSVAKRIVAGDAFFYRPSDAAKDFSVKLQFNEVGIQQISTSMFTQGVYQLKLTWKVEDESYYHETQLYIP